MAFLQFRLRDSLSHGLCILSQGWSKSPSPTCRLNSQTQSRPEALNQESSNHPQSLQSRRHTNMASFRLSFCQFHTVFRLAQSYNLKIFFLNVRPAKKVRVPTFLMIGSGGRTENDQPKDQRTRKALQYGSVHCGACVDTSDLGKQKDQSGCPSCPRDLLDNSDLFESELADSDTDTTSVTRTPG